METFTLGPTFIVGMPQQCKRQSLIIGYDYLCVPEPDNQYDEHAVAVYDGDKRMAYLRKANAKHVSKILGSVPFLSAHIRPVKEPHFSAQGPVQFCSFKICIRTRYVQRLKASLHGTGLSVC